MKIMPTIYLSLGSNIGNRKKNLQLAIKELKKILTITKLSSIIETKPMYYKKQKKFLNLAVEVKTLLKPSILLKKIKTIEKKIGRKKTFRYGPRKIDIDILFYGNKIIKTKNLIIPHPKLQERKFVLKPMVELNPRLKHPIFKKTIRELYNKL